MADREAWLKALMLVSDGPGEGVGVPCPNCGQCRIEVRYVVDADTRIGYALVWCHSCLHGISVSRVRASEGMRMWPIEDPESIVGVPRFARDG